MSESVVSFSAVDPGDRLERLGLVGPLEPRQVRASGAGRSGGGLALPALEAGELLEGVGLGLAALLRLVPLERGADLVAQLGRRERLREVADGALDRPADPVEVVGAGREHDHGDLGDHGIDRRLHLGEDGPAVLLRHHHVEDDDVGVLAHGELDGLVAVRRQDHTVAVELEVQTDELADVRLIVDHQHDTHPERRLSTDRRRRSDSARSTRRGRGSRRGRAAGRGSARRCRAGPSRPRPRPVR